MDEYTVEITKLHDSKVRIVISSPQTRTRRFDILATKGGLRISGDDVITVVPRASNSIYIDCVV